MEYCSKFLFRLRR